MSNNRESRVYILPTFFGLFFLIALAVFFAAAFAFDNDFAFVLVFVLFGFFVVSMFHVHYNLAGLDVAMVRTVSRFSGGEADVVVTLVNPSRRARRGVKLVLGRGKQGVETTVDEIAPRGVAVATLKLPLPRRGRFPVPVLRIGTAYPAGLFHSWMRRKPSAEYHAYPVPRGRREPLGETSPRFAGRSVGDPGLDDFRGHRAYERGDPPRHVDWKSLAKGRAPLTKVFGRESGSRRFFRWQDTDPQTSVEDRLSQLALWVERASRSRQSFGLSLPEVSISPGEGGAHRERCLRALAEFSPVEGGRG